jgi:hypothetical protein
MDSGLMGWVLRDSLAAGATLQGVARLADGISLKSK